MKAFIRYKKKPTIGFTFKLTRPLDQEELEPAARWLEDQKFRGEIVPEEEFNMSGKWFFGVHFEDDNDLMMFKLAWGGK